MSSIRDFAGNAFKLVGRIEPERDEGGAIRTMLPQSAYRDHATAALHAYGAGPFCRFRIGRGVRKSGLYVLTLDGVPIYAGECVDLEKRWGPNGYGGISPRNCFHGGQPTNCRVNAAILAHVLKGHRLSLWFMPHDSPREVRLADETVLIRALRPAWNKAKMG